MKKTKKEIENHIKEIDKEIEKSGVVGSYTYDWKEIDDNVIKDWKKSIEKLGGHLTMLPEFEGTDTYGFIITKEKADKKLLKKRMELEDEL